MPKKKYAEKIKSHIKCVIIKKFKVDVTNPLLFPEEATMWKSFLAELVEQNRSETSHHEEVNPETIRKIYQIIVNVWEALKARGTDAYAEKLSIVPVDYQAKLHVILQRGIMLILQMFEVRRGNENMEFLETTSFKVFDDNIYDFKYIRKVNPEAEKNNKEGSNSKCHGVIPCIVVADGFNPGEVFQWYLEHLPQKGTNKDGKRYLFPKPRPLSKGFNIHNPEDQMYEANMKGKTDFGF